ncbi:HRDC domain-containing protein [Acetobacterium tundrae]|uniref:Helicase n=1 Tax=Acetobacterium tundrae TaxID=132932 RepID=A0ABR6WQC4_9FIRM|nr:HRDC domain-containing protein [Acetobacterium tundrae]MBC3798663.1 hypothetical protein [Acetobacterium tundrae]
MALFNKLNTPIFLKEESDAFQYIVRLKELQAKATGKVKDELDREIKMVSYGELGENNIAFELKNSGLPLYVLHDIHLEINGLSAQIDYIVVTRKLVFFIECKNLFGNIDIDNQGNFVRKYSWNGKAVKEGIYSPITQNQRHLEVLKQLNRERKKNALTKMLADKYFDNFYKSIVVLANPKTVLNAKYAKKEVKEKVIRADQLNQYIKKAVQQSKEMVNSDKDMKDWAERFLALHQPGQTDYAKKYEDIINRLSETNVDQTVIQPVVVAKPVELLPAAEPAEPMISRNTELVAKLKAFRLEKSREENIKPYCVFSDQQMLDLICKMPQSLEELLGVSGFGPVRVEKYGDVILNILK